MLMVKNNPMNEKNKDSRIMDGQRILCIGKRILQLSHYILKVENRAYGFDVNQNVICFPL